MSDANEMSPEDLSAAIRSGNTNTVKKYVDHAPEWFQKRDPQNTRNTLLLSTLLNNDPGVLATVLHPEKGAKAALGMLGEKDKNGYYPIHIMAGLGKTFSVKAILSTKEGRATLDQPNQDGFRPIMTALYANKMDSVDMLRKEGAKAITQQELSSMIKLAKQKSEANGPDSFDHERTLTRLQNFEQKLLAATVVETTTQTKITEVETLKKPVKKAAELNFKQDALVSDLGKSSQKAQVAEPKMPPFEPAYIRKAIPIDKAEPQVVFRTRKSESEKIARQDSAVTKSSTNSSQPKVAFRTTVSTQNSSTSLVSQETMKEAFGVGAKGKKTEEFKLSFRNRGIQLSDGNMLTAADAGILMKHGFQPVKFPDGKYRFAKDAEPQSEKDRKPSKKRNDLDHDVVRPIPLQVQSTNSRTNGKLASL